ncbi:MAG: hypothetical protein M5U28_12595 [Sandaracinaceae bacterium]|nr:hypothetical protein [Sandaracinaceae bacterium]
MGCEVIEARPERPLHGRARAQPAPAPSPGAPPCATCSSSDGDCEVVPGWLETARARLEERGELAVVCGRRRERRPRASGVSNLLCDVEWDTPIGDARACGGDAMMRLDALLSVGGFDETLIAGEEPELCVSLRRAGWK